MDRSETLEEDGERAVIIESKEGRKESNKRDWFYTGVKTTARTKYPPDPSIHVLSRTSNSSERHPYINLVITKGNRCGGAYFDTSPRSTERIFSASS